MPFQLAVFATHLLYQYMLLIDSVHVLRSHDPVLNVSYAHSNTDAGSAHHCTTMIFKASFPPLSAIPSVSLPLGHPLPLDEHACSVSLPTWSSVVGYEEGLTEVTDKLACGYPRFVYHPYVIQLMEAALKMDTELRKDKHGCQFDCLVLPTKNSALRCHDFLARACGYFDGKNSGAAIQNSIGDSRVKLFSSDNAMDTRDISNGSSSMDVYDPESPIRVLDMNVANVHAVLFPAQTAFAIEAKSYWQHTGEIVSSRRAEVALSKLGLCAETDCKNIHANITHEVEKSRFKRVTSSFVGKEDGWKLCEFTDQPHLAQHPSEMSPDYENDSFTEIKNRIASIASTSPSSVFLTPSGMASIYAALRSARRRFIEHQKLHEYRDNVGGTSIVFGFPYLDTLKMW